MHLICICKHMWYCHLPHVVHRDSSPLKPAMSAFHFFLTVQRAATAQQHGLWMVFVSLGSRVSTNRLKVRVRVETITAIVVGDTRIPRRPMTVFTCWGFSLRQASGTVLFIRAWSRIKCFHDDVSGNGIFNRHKSALSCLLRPKHSEIEIWIY